MIIAGELITGTGSEIRAFDPVAGTDLEPGYRHGDATHVESACAAAAAAFGEYRATTSERRARFLESIADNVDALRDTLVARASAETGLPVARITGEVGRTTGQLRLFAEVLREGSWNGARIDPAQPDRAPLPRADIRQRAVPLGPVAVFGASNFPLAFLPFHELANLLMTPHSSGVTSDTFIGRAGDIAANVGRLARGETLRNVVAT
jgi:NADP-dependent aldehyde dehydrogenase